MTEEAERTPADILKDLEGLNRQLTTAETCKSLAMYASILYQSSYQEGVSYWGTSTIAEKYWEGRAQYEKEMEQNNPLDDRPAFNYRRLANSGVAVSDARYRLRLFEIFTSLGPEKQAAVPIPEAFGLDESVLQLSRSIVETHAKVAAERKSRVGLDPYRILASDTLAFRQSASPSHVAPGTSAHAFYEADILEPVRLLEAPIAKKHIPNVVYNAIAAVAIGNLQDIMASGRKPVGRWVSSRIVKATETITDKYYGNVVELTGVKLPVTDEFIHSYFSDDIRDTIDPASVTRAQFNALLAPTGKSQFVSRLNSVIYTSNDHVDATTRKADRVVAEKAIQSLTEESRAISLITHLNTDYREINSGLPTLGKKH